jgi:hypothetical protein
MRFVRGLDKDAQRKLSEYEIKDIRVLLDAVEYSIPPDKAWHKRYRPRLVIDLHGRRLHGSRFIHHSARLAINSDELEQLVGAMRDKLLEASHTLGERDLFDEIGRPKDEAVAPASS